MNRLGTLYSQELQRLLPILWAPPLLVGRYEPKRYSCSESTGRPRHKPAHEPTLGGAHVLGGSVRARLFKARGGAHRLRDKLGARRRRLSDSLPVDPLIATAQVDEVL